MDYSPHASSSPSVMPSISGISSLFPLLSPRPIDEDNSNMSSDDIQLFDPNVILSGFEALDQTDHFPSFLPHHSNEFFQSGNPKGFDAHQDLVNHNDQTRFTLEQLIGAPASSTSAIGEDLSGEGSNFITLESVPYFNEEFHTKINEAVISDGASTFNPSTHILQQFPTHQVPVSFFNPRLMSRFRLNLSHKLREMTEAAKAPNELQNQPKNPPENSNMSVTSTRVSEPGSLPIIIESDKNGNEEHDKINKKRQSKTPNSSKTTKRKKKSNLKKNNSSACSVEQLVNSAANNGGTEFNKELGTLLYCHMCKNKYKHRGTLKRHLIAKHEFFGEIPEDFDLVMPVPPQTQKFQRKAAI